MKYKNKWRYNISNSTCMYIHSTIQQISNIFLMRFVLKFISILFLITKNDEKTLKIVENVKITNCYLFIRFILLPKLFYVLCTWVLQSLVEKENYKKIVYLTFFKWIEYVFDGIFRDKLNKMGKWFLRDIFEYLLVPCIDLSKDLLEHSIYLC